MRTVIAPESTRTWRPDWPCPVGAILAQQRRGAGDPTHRFGVAGRHWRASRTPEGPVTLAIREDRAGGNVHAQAWGTGAEWALHQLPALLGAEDDWSGFEPREAALAEARRHHPHLRQGRTDRVLEALVPAVIEQKVTGKQAFGGFRQLVKEYGDPAPGPGAEIGLWLQPSADVLGQVPSWAWLRFGIDGTRARTVVAVAERAAALERLVGVTDVTQVDRALRSIPGVGTWTSAETRQRALADPDAVSFGDYHVGRDVGWALAGREFDDRELAAFLEPWRPQRGRVPFLVAAAGLRRPRRGPRMEVPGHIRGVT